MTDRLSSIRKLAEDQQFDAILVTPGPDLRYLTGYDAKPLERLTCLVVRPGEQPVLIAPLLERAAAEAAGIEIMTWTETEDPFALLRGLLPDRPTRLAVDDHMWAIRLLALQALVPSAQIQPAGSLLSQLRIIKSSEEINALREAGAAIDRVHARMGEFLRIGRTEREVGRDIAAAIVDEGHETVDFVIVGSGPNGASPHHELSDRVIGVGEPVVVDIGGTTPRGYCSDCTRNYVIGDAPADYATAFAHLRRAQAAQVEAVRPGVAAAFVDAVGRGMLSEAGLGPEFIHRTGHGIGQETHEEPYIVAGNALSLESGMAFSIEPGIYREGQWGARIEDIVVVTEGGVEVLNHAPRSLVVLDS